MSLSFFNKGKAFKMVAHNVTLEDVELSPNHHRNMSDTAALIAGPYMVTLTFLGIFENLLVLLVFVRHKTLLRHSNNVLVMSIAGVDFLVSVVSFPFSAASSVANRWLFSTWACQWYAASMTCLGLTSICLLTCLAVERFIVITLKAREPAILSVGRAKRFALASLFLGTILGACPLLGWGSYDLELVFPSCAPVWWKRDPNNLTFILIIFTAAFFMPVCIITVAYVMIFKKTWQRQTDSSLGQSSREVRVALISLAMIVFFLLSWGPYALVALLQTFNETFYVPDALNIVPVMMAKSSVVWNPIIYLGRNIRFIRAFSEDLTNTRKSLTKFLQGASSSTSERTSSGRASSDNVLSGHESRRERHTVDIDMPNNGDLAVSSMLWEVNDTIKTELNSGLSYACTNLLEVYEYETSV